MLVVLFACCQYMLPRAGLYRKNPMKILKTFTLGLLPIIALALGFQLGTSYEWHRLETERLEMQELFTMSGSGRTVLGDPEKEVDLSLLWSVWRLLQRHYIHPQEMVADQMVFGAVGGLTDALGDPYTVFMTPPDTKSFEDSLSGTLEGIGAQLDLQDGQIVVVAPLKGSPAEKAGLLPKDIIIMVNGEELQGMRLDEVVQKIRGPKGTTVTLTVVREDRADPLTLTVVRDSIHIPSVESKVVKMQTGSVAVLALNQFGDDSMAEMKKAIEALPPGLKGVVLDLRFNGGGYLEGAVQLVSMFLKSGEVVTVERRDVPAEKHHVLGRPLLPDIPLVVLINEGSASASEIAAGALQDHKRAVIVGTKSFGKGTVQEIIDLPGGSALRVTTAKWLTPAGQDLAKKGITPDIAINRTTEEYRADKDPQMDAAIQVLFGKRPLSTGTGSAKN